MDQHRDTEPLPRWSQELEIAALRGVDHASQGNVPQAESIAVTSVWQLESPDAADRAMSDQAEAYVYRRVAHPNARALATKLATLHGAKRAIVTAQGMSAIAAVAIAGLHPGAQVWMGEELYGETSLLLADHLTRWQVQVRTFDPCDPQQVSQLAAAGPVELVFIETITNPRVRIPDIAAVAGATHQAGGRLVVDNTFATYLLCRPLELGADIVVESLGKQVNGHSDGMLGLIAGQDERHLANIANVVKTFGWASSPLDCYLTHRGLPSLALRMERACANAMALADQLSQIDGVRVVDYPGLVTHTGNAAAIRQFRGGFGWMLCFQIAADRAQVERLFKALRPDIRFVPSLGDSSTTLSHPLSTSHRGTATELLTRLGIDHGTIRVSCGIEPTQWLVDRFSQALQEDCND